ncbi:hypothetical protein AGLY_008583 [Aphis glycines]|uniref:Uncharacterized protein n=1 Tax=Aphis glycines TaxID=307491 RepID=A0A6G0TMP3_APHGL|nr:hypothetical protein AGLY_008583 [Aphis glycines]
MYYCQSVNPYSPTTILMFDSMMNNLLAKRTFATLFVYSHGCYYKELSCQIKTVFLPLIIAQMVLLDELELYKFWMPSIKYLLTNPFVGSVIVSSFNIKRSDSRFKRFNFCNLLMNATNLNTQRTPCFTSKAGIIDAGCSDIRDMRSFWYDTALISWIYYPVVIFKCMDSLKYGRYAPYI